MMAGKQKYLISIVGPTAVGKTSLVIKLAQHFDTDIISSDSRQFYKEMAIGTAKPTQEELRTAKHHFIASHSIEDEFTAGQFEEQVITMLHKLHKNKDVVLMTGGSGLYVNAVLNGLEEMPEVKQTVRQELNEKLAQKGLPTLLKELEQVDLDYYNIVDKANPHRIIRGLEIFYSTGKQFSQLRTGSKKERPFEIIKIGLDRPREELYERINERVEIMMEQGLIEEVKRLMPYRSKQALQTVGYKELFEYLEGKLSLTDAVALIKQNTRRYAKRQLTWFRKDTEIKWFHPNQLAELIQFLEAQIV